MRVRLRGLNSTRKKLADGTLRTYWYPWKGGPRLRGPGDPEFIASYNEAVARKIKLPGGFLQSIIVKFENTVEFCSLADRTKADYKQIIDQKIVPEFGDFPLAALTNKRARGIFKDWRDRLALRSPRQADYAWAVLARIFSVAFDRGWIDCNPCEKGGRLYHGTRADNIWTPEQVDTFLQAPPHLLSPLMLALWTGQREGDLLNLLRFAYDGSRIRLVQSKSIRLGNLKKARRVCIPVGTPLKAMLDAMPRRRDEHILLNSYGQPWTEDGFRSAWGKECKKLGIVGVTFNDLRGTAVTRLALVGCSEAQIATITGHTLGQVRSILDAHYLHRHPELGEQAIRKLEAGTDSSNRAPNWRELFNQERMKS
jgi:integrase